MIPAPAPEIRPNSSAAATFLEAARAAAKLCGVTRLGDVTGLDRLGLPVWQAVRPGGRSLSVHQGKGATAVEAKIGALCEAIEAHEAEHVQADGPLAAFEALPSTERAPDIGDYCRLREARPAADAPMQWCEAVGLATGNRHYLPHLLVSLDYRSGLPSLIERVSGGTGAGASEEDAARVALLELLERDATGQWNRAGKREQAADALRLESVPFEWFQNWVCRLSALDIDIQAFAIQSLIGTPVFMCIIGGVEEFGTGYRRFYGTAAHPDAETALFKALAEAIQSRLTLIAGTRDDILPSYYKRHDAARRPANWPPAGARLWTEAEARSASLAEMVEDLARLGYRQVQMKRLDRDLPGVAVARLFVPGLGSLTRTRRTPV